MLYYEKDFVEKLKYQGVGVVILILTVKKILNMIFFLNITVGVTPCLVSRKAYFNEKGLAPGILMFELLRFDDGLCILADIVERSTFLSDLTEVEVPELVYILKGTAGFLFERSFAEAVGVLVGFLEIFCCGGLGFAMSKLANKS